MSHHQNALEALAQLSHVAGLIDTAECKDEGLYNRLQSALAVSNAALDDAALAAAPQVVADERAAFEIEERKNTTNLQRQSDGQYENPCTQSAWEGWQARASLAAAPMQAQEPNHELMQLLGMVENDDVHDIMAMAVMRIKRLQAAPVQAQEPVAWRYEWASCVTGDGPQNFKLTFGVEPPPEWAVQDGQARNVVKLYAAPVQTVAVPDGELPTDPLGCAGYLAGMAFGNCPADEIGHCVSIITAAIAAPAAQGDAITRQQIAEIIDSYTDAGTNEVDTYDAADAILTAIAAKAAS